MSQAKYEQPQWKQIGGGQYNAVYRSPDGLTILKVPTRDAPSDKPERAVRLWNEINPGFPARITLVLSGEKQVTGWLCPYIEGTAPSDTETSDCVIDIFNRTGRIFCDAVGRKNLIKTSSGKVVCIDVGMLLQLDYRKEVVHPGNLIRRSSQVSIDTWEEYAPDFYTDFFPQARKKKPIATHTIEALIFIKVHRPNILDVSFLKDFPDLTVQLATALYDKKTDAVLARMDKIAASLTGVSGAAGAASGAAAASKVTISAGTATTAFFSTATDKTHNEQPAVNGNQSKLAS